MTLEADIVPLGRGQLVGIQDRPVAAVSQVLRGIAVAAAAAYTALGKRSRGKPVRRLRQRRLDAGRVAVQAVGIDWQRRGHARDIAEVRGHVPDAAFAVEVDRQLKPLPIHLVQVGPAAMSRADEVLETPFSVQSGQTVALLR